MKLFIAACLLAVSLAQTGSSAGSPWNYYNPYMDEMIDEYGPMAMQMMGGFSGQQTPFGTIPQIPAYNPMYNPMYGGDFQDAMGDMAEDLIDSGLLNAYMPMLSGLFGMPMGGGGTSGNSMTGGALSASGGSATSSSSAGMTGSMSGYGGHGMAAEEQMDNYQDMMEDQMEAQREQGMYGGGSQGYYSGSVNTQAHPAGGAFLNRIRRQQPRFRRPSRLLRQPYMTNQHRQMLRKPHVGTQGQTGGMWNSMFNGVNSAMSMFGYDGMDSEDRMMALMMGASPSQLPPPTDGIDFEDMWMYGQSNPFYPAAHSATKAVTDAVHSQSGSSSSTGTTHNPFSQFPWWTIFSSLQRPRPQKF